MKNRHSDTNNTDFSINKLATELGWDDLVVHPSTLESIKELENWLVHHIELLDDWGMRARIKPGFRVYMHGPPGTGKTLAASLLGTYTNRAVYRMNLSDLVYKYIGETEKNLAALFDNAAKNNWILFFDEADSIFGKRTNVRDAHDKYANQEVSYLLQRLEDHPGLVILASHSPLQPDGALARRFQLIIPFDLPNADQRKLLWTKNLPSKLQLAPDIDLDAISQNFELSGANIIAIIRDASLKVLSNDSNTLTKEILLREIKKELSKGLQAL